MWSLGVLLFELCTGCDLWHKDINDDSIVHKPEALKDWTELSLEQLDMVFADALPVGSCTLQQRLCAQDLLLWCLNAEPSRRPTMQEVVEHPFLRKEPTALDPRELQQLDLLGQHQSLAMLSVTVQHAKDIEEATQQSALHTATSLLDPEAVELLLQCFADPTMPNAWGDTPLHILGFAPSQSSTCALRDYRRLQKAPMQICHYCFS